MTTETTETTDETTTSETVLTVAGYVGVAMIAAVALRKGYGRIRNFRANRIDEALTEADVILEAA